MSRVYFQAYDYGPSTLSHSADDTSPDLRSYPPGDPRPCTVTLKRAETTKNRLSTQVGVKQHVVTDRRDRGKSSLIEAGLQTLYLPFLSKEHAEDVLGADSSVFQEQNRLTIQSRSGVGCYLFYVPRNVSGRL